MRRLIMLAVASAALGVAGCGGEDENVERSPAQAPAREAGRDLRCAEEPPGKVADGVRDDQGGSVPGTDPCAGPGS